MELLTNKKKIEDLLNYFKQKINSDKYTVNSFVLNSKSEKYKNTVDQSHNFLQELCIDIKKYLL